MTHIHETIFQIFQLCQTQHYNAMCSSATCFFSPSILFVWYFCRLIRAAEINLMPHPGDLVTPRSLTRGDFCPVHLIFRVYLLLGGREPLLWKPLHWLSLDSRFLGVNSSSVACWRLQSAPHMEPCCVSMWQPQPCFSSSVYALSRSAPSSPYRLPHIFHVLSQFCQLSKVKDTTLSLILSLATGNPPWWGHLHQGNGQMTEIRSFGFGNSPEHHFITQTHHYCFCLNV